MDPEYRSNSFFLKYFQIFGNTRNILCICCSISIFVLLIIAFAVIVPINIGNINITSAWPEQNTSDTENTLLTACAIIAIIWLLTFTILMYFVVSSSYLNRRTFVDFWSIIWEHKIYAILSTIVLMTACALCAFQPGSYWTVVVCSIETNVYLLIFLVISTIYPVHIYYQRLDMANHQRDPDNSKNRLLSLLQSDKGISYYIVSRVDARE